MSHRWGSKIKNSLGTAATSVSTKAKDTKETLSKKTATKDASFIETLKYFDEEKNTIGALTTNITSFMGGADAIIAAQKELAENLLKLAPEGSPMHSLCKAQLQTCEEMIKAKKALLDNTLNQSFSNPVNLYMGQYRELTDRVRERNRRESDMDKLAHQRDKYKEKGDARLAATETRLVTAQSAYEDLNKELLEDIPKLIDDSPNFFQPLILLLIMNQAKFWSTMAEHAIALAQRVDPNMAVIPPVNQVITPKQVSAMTKKYVSASDPWSNNISQQQPQQAYGLQPSVPGPQSNPWGAPPAQNNPYNPPLPQPTPQYNQPLPQPTPQYNQPLPHPIPNQYNQPLPTALPPRPAPVIPQQPRLPQARAMWDFAGQDASELSFRAGDIIFIVEQKGDWWTGEKDGKRGLLPANYVQMT